MTENSNITKRAIRYRAQFPSKKACLKRINKTIDSFKGKNTQHNINLKNSYHNALELREVLVNMD